MTRTTREYDITTSLGADMALLIAFLMDGGMGGEYEYDDGAMALAKEYGQIISSSPV